VLPDEEDPELERRGDAFVRYADDLSVYVRTTVVAKLETYLTGWMEHLRWPETPGGLRDLDRWIRQCLRCSQLKRRKQDGKVNREMRARGATSYAAAHVAANPQSWWLDSAIMLNAVLPNRSPGDLGAPSEGPA
jgi:hypothetical protein